MRVIFVGEKPSPRMKKNAKPFEGAVCFSRLLTWIVELNAKPYSLFNRVDKNISNIIKQEIRDSEIKVIALGNVASDFLKNEGIEHFKLPHPSFRNRKLNNKKFMIKQLKLAKKYLGTK